MNFPVTFVYRLCAALALSGLVFTANADPSAGKNLNKAAEFAQGTFDKTAALERRAAVHAWLMTESVQRGQGAAIRADVSATEMAEIDNAPRSVVPERVGLTKTLAASIDFAGITPADLNGRAVSRNYGTMAGTPDGGYVYTATLSSAGATALRVHFTGFRLPENAGAYLYTEDGQVFGPYTGRGPLGDGEFWSHTLMGDTVYLQLRHDGAASASDLRNTRLNVAGLGHVRPRWLGFCNGNAACIENIDCSTTDPDIDYARNAIAHMQWISGPFIYICSGGLLADTDDNSQIPYFLSANHCISRGKDARNLENFFRFEASCGAPADCDDIFDTRANHPQDLRTLGATITSTRSSADYTLFELREPAPGNSTFLGWNADPVAYTDGTGLYRISHPNGAPQAYSEHSVDALAPTCQSWPRGNRIYSRDTYGATEGGSSGSPVMNGLGEVVGQLSGACGYDVNNQCNSEDKAPGDGAFAAYFSEVAQFLDPTPSSCTTTENPEQTCDDGLDNDCDGAIDAADSDCSTTGLPPGSPCTANDECASGKCRGRSGDKMCR